MYLKPGDTVAVALGAPEDIDVQSATGMESEYMRLGTDGRSFATPASGARPDRIKPQMQTNLQAIGGAPHHSMDSGEGVRPRTSEADLLKFDEIVLESNEVDLADL